MAQSWSLIVDRLYKHLDQTPIDRVVYDLIEHLDTMLGQQEKDVDMLLVENHLLKGKVSELQVEVHRLELTQKTAQEVSDTKENELVD